MAKKVIIVTGPIGSGKSTAIEHISNKGYPTLDLDKISNEIINSKESIKFLDNNFPGVIKNKRKSLLCLLKTTNKLSCFCSFDYHLVVWCFVTVAPL